jgi:hypothetical protein
MISDRAMRRAHVAVGALICLVLPIGSWLEGSQAFAWTMFARSGEYRLEVLATDMSGRASVVNPTALAASAAPNARTFLGGADHWRTGSSLYSLRAHLDDLGEHACRETHAAAVDITLRERLREGDPERATTRHVPCRR